MKRYQPLDQIQNGIPVYMIVDTVTDTLMPESWYDESDRTRDLTELNAPRTAHAAPTPDRDPAAGVLISISLGALLWLAAFAVYVGWYGHAWGLL